MIQNRLEKIKNTLNEDIILVAVSKTKPIEQIKSLYDIGHVDFGENKVQEAIDKWTEVKKKNSVIRLHMIGKLQTNKVKLAVKIFDFIHSLDNLKLAKKISEEEIKKQKKIKIFIQVNIGNEKQKSGINKDNLKEFYNYCKSLDLDIIGIMCLPPFGEDPKKYFIEMKILNENFKFKELSMGMSSDFLNAIEYNSSYLRIGSSIFGQRS